MDGTAAIAPSRQTEVNSQLGVLSNILGGLGDKLQELENRLAGVLRSPTSTTQQEATDQASLVPLAASIRDRVEIAELLDSRIQLLLERLEL